MHLRSYFSCREQRRLHEWESVFGKEFCSLLSPSSARENALFRRLVRGGIPKHLREKVYMSLSGKLVFLNSRDCL